MNESWIEVEDGFLTNRPTYWVGRGKNRRQEPDMSIEPTEAWLFCYKCRRTKRGISRSRFLHTIRGRDEDALNQAVADYCESKVVIKPPAAPLSYVSSNAEPAAVPL